MRILSIIITLSFIIAASAYAGERRSDSRESRNEPAAAVQTRARTQAGTPAVRVGLSQSSTTPAKTTYAPTRSEKTPVTPAYSPATAPRTSGYSPAVNTNTRPATESGRQTTQQSQYRPGSSERTSYSPSPTIVAQNSAPKATYTSHRVDSVTEKPVRTPTAPTVNNAFGTYRSDRDDRDKHYTPRQPDNRPDTTPRQVTSKPSAPPIKKVQVPTTTNVIATSYNPSGNRYTIGYRPTKYVAPKAYKPPVYKQGYYHYAPTYYSRPCSYGYWAFEYAPGFSWRSAYFHFGVLPYVQITRITHYSYNQVGYRSDPVYVSGRPYSYGARFDGLDEALADIRSAWIGGRFDLIERHVRPGRTVAVLVDGQYDYAISSDDYLAMTYDAMRDLATASFVWDTVRERRDGVLTAFGQHSYRVAGKTRDVFVTYSFERIGQSYYLVEVGSSLNPLR